MISFIISHTVMALRVGCHETQKCHILLKSKVGLDIQQMQNQKRQAKVLLSADCRGLLESLMGKVQQLQLKNQFDFMLLTGEVCHPRAASFVAALRSAQRHLPIPAYFIDSSEMAPVLQKLHPDGMEIAPNLHFLGRQGVTTIRETTIAFFSHNPWQGVPDEVQIQKFLQACRGRRVDVLLTNAWSREAREIAKQQAKTEDYVSRLAAAINPHYHIAAGGSQFYRMPAYINSDGLQSHFISVAPYEEPPKGKYLFGLTVKPGQQEAPTTVGNPIDNPYSGLASTHSVQKQGRVSTNFTIRSEPDNSEVVVFFEGFPDWSRSSDITEFLQRWGELKTIEVQRELVRGSKCGIVRFRSAESTASCLASSQKVLFHTKRIKFSRRTLKESRRVEECWFCKTKGDSSLILLEGQHCYLSLEKGPITRHHLQLIPNAHVETAGRLEFHEKEELQRYAQTVSAYYAQNGYEVMVYQRYLHLSEAINHTVLHIVPVEQGSQLLKKFEQLNKSDNLGFKPQREQARKSQYFIRAEVCGRSFIKEIGRKERVQADFMRIVLSQLTGNARLANWKQCVRGEEEVGEVRREVTAILKKIGLMVQQQ